MYNPPFIVTDGLPTIKRMADSGGNMNANGNYSSVITDFYYQPPPGITFHIRQVSFVLSTSSGTFNQIDYGSIANGLTNGIIALVSNNGVETQLLNNLTIKQNNDYYVITSNVEKSIFAGTPQTLSASLNLVDDFGEYITLHGNDNDRIIVRLHDNFTSLSQHSFILRGVMRVGN